MIEPETERQTDRERQVTMKNYQTNSESQEFTRKDLLNQDSKTKGANKVVFTFTYHPI